ncbi:MAG: histidine kinase [Saprospiraceae bacterium]|nr:histidine kinase [Lewinella sp.]
MRSIHCQILICLLLPALSVRAQTLRTAIQERQTLQLEWVQQRIEQADDLSYPLYPDQFSIGDWEVRVGLAFSKSGTGEVEGQITHISYLIFPEKDNADNSLPAPTIVDTRFQSKAQNALLHHFNQLTEIPFLADCREQTYEAWLQLKQKGLAQVLRQSYRDDRLSNSILDKTLPAAFGVKSLAEVMCKLLESELPEQEAFIPLETVDGGNEKTRDFFRVDYPPRRTVLRGQIESPAGPEVRIKFFKNDNWFDFWRDTVIQLDSNGCFSLAFPFDIPQTVNLFHAYKTMRFYLRPGDSLSFTTNANALYRAMKFGGTAAENQQTLLDFYHSMRGDTLYRSYDHQLLEYDQLEFLQKLLWKEKRGLQFIDNRRKQISADLASFLERDIRLGYSVDIWEAARRFYWAEGVSLHDRLAAEAENRAPLLYRLPPQRTFDSNAEEYCRFQMARLRELGIPFKESAANNFQFRGLLLSQETLLRFYGLLFFRAYSDENGLNPQFITLLNTLIEGCKDPDLIADLKVFSNPGAKRQEVIYYIPNVRIGRPAPDWSFKDREGVEVSLSGLKGKKVLLHAGWLEHLESALADIDIFRQDQSEFPAVVHLLVADSRSDFERGTRGREGLFVYVPKEDQEMLRDSYRIENRSNHYFLLDEEGIVIAGNYELGTPHKMRGVWEKIYSGQAAAVWTTEERLQYWRILGGVAGTLLLLSLLYLWRRGHLEKLELRKRKLLELELKGIRSQMNPHFLFNAMGSIQNLIRTNKQEKADLYLSSFAGLMRRILRNSGEEFITLSEEIDTIEQYCNLEALRHPFVFEIEIDPDIDPHTTYIPAMILQPLVENAIVHGLLPKKGSKQLCIVISQQNMQLACKIIDNGIGIKAAEKQKTPHMQERKSYGLALVSQRLALLGVKGNETLLIEDRGDWSPPESGTQVSFFIPVEQ